MLAVAAQQQQQQQQRWQQTHVARGKLVFVEASDRAGEELVPSAVVVRTRTAPAAMTQTASGDERGCAGKAAKVDDQVIQILCLKCYVFTD